MPPKLAASISGRRGGMPVVARAASGTSSAGCSADNGRLQPAVAASGNVGYEVGRLLDVARSPKRVQRGTDPDILP